MTLILEYLVFLNKNHKFNNFFIKYIIYLDKINL